MHFILPLLLLALFAAGCGTDRDPPARSDEPAHSIPPPPREPLPTDTTGPAADTNTESAEWTAGIVEVQRPNVRATLRDVRSAAHDGFDRVVFEFEGNHVPGYHAEYIDEPVRQCGSGSPVPLAGEVWLEIRLSPARAHTEAGAPTTAERSRAPELPVLRELALTCDFEGIVTWVLGLTAPNRYRFIELSDPARLVVDVRQ